MRGTRGWAVGLIIAAAVVAAPAYLTEFHVHLFTEILILALFASAFNLLFGYTGLLSFGQAAYFGIGAYAAAFVLKGALPSLPLALLAGGAAAALAALVIGFLCVRRDEIYFAMVTLAFGQLVFVVLWRWRDLTGGSDGIGGITRPPLGPGPLAVDLSTTVAYFYFTLAVVGTCLYALWRLTRSPLGLTLQAIRDNPQRVEYLGLSMRGLRLLSFVVAGFFSGVAGGLFAPYQGTVAPWIADWTVSAEPVLMTLLGGFAVFWGPALGAGLFIVIKDTVGSLTEYWPLVVGSIVIALVLFLPGGVAEGMRRLARRLRRADGGAPAEPSE